jgi:hypothetical protein
MGLIVDSGWLDLLGRGTRFLVLRGGICLGSYLDGLELLRMWWGRGVDGGGRGEGRSWKWLMRWRRTSECVIVIRKVGGFVYLYFVTGLAINMDYELRLSCSASDP